MTTSATYYGETIVPAGVNAGDPKLVNYTRAELAYVLCDLDLMSDLMGGSRKMWERSKYYIRQWPDEQDTMYDVRRYGETLFEGTKRTLNASIGMLFAKPPSMDWGAIEQQGEAFSQDVDTKGTAFDIFAKRFSEVALRDGLAVILVDHTTPPPNVEINAANEEALNLRPTWAFYRRAQTISWREETINGAKTLTQIVFHEPTSVNVETFGVQRVNRYRVCRLFPGEGGTYLAAWQVWEQIKEAALYVEAFRVIGAGFFRNRFGEIADRLPIAIAYTGMTEETLCSTIPLLPVGWANLSHWQLSTNLRYYLNLCCFPQPVVIGEIQNEAAMTAAGLGVIAGKIRLGPGVGVHLKAGGDFHWAELEGSSIERIEHAINEKLQQMAQQGVAFLTVETRAAETAEAKRIDSVAQNATLSTGGRGIEDAINVAWEWTAWYFGVEADGAPTYSMNRDFENESLDAPTMLAYVTAVEKAGLPIRILLEAWQRGKRIDQDADLDDVEREMQAAIDEQKAQDAQDKQDQLDLMREKLSGGGGGPAAKKTPAGTGAGSENY